MREETSTSAILSGVVFGASLTLMHNIEEERKRQQDELIDAYINRPFSLRERLLAALKNEVPYRPQREYDREWVANHLKTIKDGYFGNKWDYTNVFAGKQYNRAQELMKLSEASLKSDLNGQKTVMLSASDAHLLRDYL